MKSTDPQFTELRAALMRHAALSGPFRPGNALRAVVGKRIDEEPMLMLDLLSSLQPSCSVQRDDEGDLWTLRTGVRHKVLARNLKYLQENPQGFEKSDVLQALLAQGEFAPDQLDRLPGSDVSDDRLQAQILALDRAGPAAPGHDRLDALRAILNQRASEHSNDAALSAGFVGRKDELDQLASWVGAAGTKRDEKVGKGDKGGVHLQTMHVSGLPGIGKSYLLERVIQLVRQTDPPLLVRLDFDRSALQFDTPAAIFTEISRRVGDGVPEAANALHQARIQSAEEVAGLSSTSTEPPRQIMAALSEALVEYRGCVLVVLDTLEALRAQGDTHIVRLFEHLDHLAQMIAPPICVISAGRADAMAPASRRIRKHIHLGGLEDPAARDLLREQGVPEDRWDDILSVAQGIPLRLVLAGKLARDGALDTTDMPRDVADGVIEGYLYRGILSRVPEPIRRVALEGLILLRINRAALREVVAPALDTDFTPDQADNILYQLQHQHWLVTTQGEGQDQWIMHRTDIRSAVLELIYTASPELTAQIDARAAEWFADIHPLTALYHRLQMLRHGGDLPEVPGDLAHQFSDPMLYDLPQRAADAVRQARGQRSDYGRADFEPDDDARPPSKPQPPTQMPVDLGDPEKSELVQLLKYGRSRRRFTIGRGSDAGPDLDPRALRDLELMLGKSDLREAAYVIEQGFDVPFSLAGQAGQIVMAQQWISGHWSVARRIFDTLPEETIETSIAEFHQPLSMVLLEMWAEFRFDRLLQKLADDKFLNQTVETIFRSEGTGMNGGALAFALTCANPEIEVPSQFEVEQSVLAPHLSGMNDGTTLSAIADANHRREALALSLRGNKSEVSQHTSGVDLAPLNPYGEPLLNLIRHAETGDSQDLTLLRYLQGMRPSLPVVAANFAPDLEGVENVEKRLNSQPSDAAEALNGMGLSAEWSTAFAYVHPIANLPMVARAAERWRRTVNGLWSYGATKPEGWTGTDGADLHAMGLAKHLFESGDPQAALSCWTGDDADGPLTNRLWRRVGPRYETALRKASAAQGDYLTNVLDHLFADELPASIAAPLAALATQRADLD